MSYYQAIEKIQAEVQEQLQEMYELLDPRAKGFIDTVGLIDAMKALGYEIDKRQVGQMIEYLDQSNKGVISKEAFMKFMTGRLDYRDEAQDLKGAFQYFDQAGKGAIRLGDFARIAQQLGEQPQECERMLRQADKDEDGNISWQQFSRVIKKTSYF